MQDTNELCQKTQALQIKGKKRAQYPESQEERKPTPCANPAYRSGNCSMTREIDLLHHWHRCNALFSAFRGALFLIPLDWSVNTLPCTRMKSVSDLTLYR